MKNLNQEQFNEMKNTEGLKVVDFFAEWCGPCKMLAPVLEDLSSSISDVEFSKINIDENMELAQEYGVTTIPTLVFMKDGQELSRKVGFIPRNVIEEEVDKLK